MLINICIFTGTETKKGCLVDLPEADSIRKECENATSGSCLKCDSNLCNKNDPLKCVKCNENDDTCTSNTAAELAAKVAVCKINEDRCYVSHDSKKYLITQKITNTHIYIYSGCPDKRCFF